ncbi:MAG: hypothetical protein AAGA86_09980, partial [Bacteroidota bacterium]
MKTEMTVTYPYALFCDLPALVFPLNPFDVLGLPLFGTGWTALWTSLEIPGSLDWAITTVCYLVLPLLSVLMFTVIVVLLKNQYTHLSIKKRIKAIQEETHSTLADLIFSTKGPDSLYLKVYNFKKKVPFQKAWCRDYLRDEILNLSENYQVDPARYLEIYKLFGFYEKSRELLSHRKWYYRSLGIYRLQRI